MRYDTIQIRVWAQPQQLA